ncbi:MAG: sucrase ferredoxin [Corynebacterium sp.]|nr:sucrase ferredoxin [Corynebacterium sp.]
MTTQSPTETSSATTGSACSNICSDLSALTPEPLPGSARTAGMFVCLEFLHGWGHDVLDGEALGEELSAALKAKLAPVKGALQLIRKPGRAGQHRQTRRAYLIWPELAIAEAYETESPEDILDLDFSGPGKNPGGVEVTEPFLLMCTHGKRDKCCATKGRPIAAAMQACFYGDEVWESSHVKGHRFAPAAILMPWGYSYGRLSAGEYIDVVKEARQGRLVTKGNRGRAIYGAGAEAAELAVAAISQEPIGSLQVSEISPELFRVESTAPAGRTWQVSLEWRTVEGVVASCGKAPKPGRAPFVVGVREGVE